MSYGSNLSQDAKDYSSRSFNSRYKPYAPAPIAALPAMERGTFQRFRVVISTRHLPGSRNMCCVQTWRKQSFLPRKRPS